MDGERSSGWGAVNRLSGSLVTLNGIAKGCSS